MSRHFRSALQLASSTAGPSSLRPTQIARLPLAITVQTRQASTFGFNILPQWMRRKSAPEGTETAEASTGAPEGEVGSTGSLFDEVAREARQTRRQAHTEHSYKTAYHKISHRKLNDLSRQISGLPIDEAIVQMEFSEKRASDWIKSTLCLARDHAMDKGLRRSRLVVAETWVSKGRKLVRVDIKGRGRAGMKHHPSARLHLLLKEGQTQAEKESKRYQKELGRVRSAGIVREDGVLRRKVVSGWAW